jgi:NAD(P)-dependent dehydrogenase (short-subunit alcohol dehydrogenase family)
MLLKNKNAVIYGASDSLGGAVAKAFAKEGARVFLSNRNGALAGKVADEIIATGGDAEAQSLDAMDEKAINKYLDGVLAKAGTIDISFNAIGLKDTQNIPLVEMKLDDFTRPIGIAMQTQFLTSTAAGRIMIKQRSGVILSLTATPGGIGYPMVGGFGPACWAIESLSRGLASELGPYGVRVVNIRSAGSPDSRPFKEAIAAEPILSDGFLQKLKEDTMLKELPLMHDIANTAVFLASHMAEKITGITMDVTAGTTSALNYKTTVIPFKKL